MYKCIRRLLSTVGLQLLAVSLLVFSCNTIDVYEKVVAVPAHQWQSNYIPQFSFEIKDTTILYQAFIILRHNNQYRYNNIWVTLQTKGPADSLQSLRLELPLANKEGWLGTGMDDIYEHRIKIGSEISRLPFVQWTTDGFRFTNPGTYTFSLQQIMRDDPLMNVMNAGLRLEKKMP